MYSRLHNAWVSHILLLQGPAPLWIPDKDEAAQTNLARFMNTFQVGNCLATSNSKPGLLALGVAALV